ncbi:nickel permease [Heyndrickxia ginsengihumi]|uniref:Nickel/cobalt efflux system n=1 Tax=Heyndrickxia ginsengihumi TaxID=363870 RepID=A0A0A6VAV5_9BACI|nr:nickel permease [Heyndrickxia ginsengihumi]
MRFGYAICVIMLHIIGILCLLISVQDHTVLFGLGLVAYTLGLRHAFDVDHIAAIDTTVRKLVQQQKNPSGVGFFFSLGHSTVVCLIAIVTAFASQWAIKKIPEFQHIGGIIGTSVSGIFLLIMGIINLFIMYNIYRVFIVMRKGNFDAQKLENLLDSRGLLARFVAPLLKLVTKSWHIYPIGFLFGLGFDTASEVALLAISAGAAKSAIPVTGILALPLLFAAGMSLFDTVDGIFMTSTYRWAFISPIRKVYYNLTVTALAVVTALLVGIVELVQVLTPQLGLTEGFWKWIQQLNFGSLGYILVCLFILAWAISYGLWKLLRIEKKVDIQLEE